MCRMFGTWTTTLTTSTIGGTLSSILPSAYLKREPTKLPPLKKLFILPSYICLASLSWAGAATSKAAPAEVAKSGPSSQESSSQSGPIRVLFLGTEEAGSRKHCHTVMRDFGRDALWFDYTADSAQ